MKCRKTSYFVQGQKTTQMHMAQKRRCETLTICRQGTFSDVESYPGKHKHSRSSQILHQPCVGGSPCDHSQAEHCGKAAHAGPLVLRALCEENPGYNSLVPPGPTSSAPFPPTALSVVVILKGQLMILLKHPKLVCKSTQVSYLSCIFET